MNKTQIPWCDYTWNPITGCSKISEGCQNCYAHALANRFNGGEFGGTMTQKPILFKGEMVRAILNGSKTQTRRVVKDQCVHSSKDCEGNLVRHCCHGTGYYKCPQGQKGDGLWVRETWGVSGINGQWAIQYACGHVKKAFPDHYEFLARAATKYAGNWRPSIFMPRWASRINLEITGVRVERLQDITETDAEAEGVTVGQKCCNEARCAYARLWDSINGKRPGCAWADNPWVWVVEFRRAE